MRLLPWISSDRCKGPAVLSCLFVVVVAVTLGFFWVSVGVATDDVHAWSEKEKGLLRSLWLGSLGPPPATPSNRYAQDPQARDLGRRFFFDPRFSGNMRVSCATCHRADYSFTDDLPLAHGMGTTARRTMPLVGLAYQVWFFWDGRKDSMWSQALGPIESPVEHGFSRTQCFSLIRQEYRKEYERVFGPFPAVDPGQWKGAARPGEDPDALKAWVTMSAQDRDSVNRVYANMGKAIAAFVGSIMPGPARFDEYVDAALAADKEKMVRTFTPMEAKGLRLFIGKAGCVNCHNGPLFSNGDFHHVGVPDTAAPDSGRQEGIVKVLADEFNCLSSYSDAEPGECLELRFLDTEIVRYRGAFKTPTLRNVAMRPPYMHAGQFRSLGEVLKSYRAHARRIQQTPDPEHPVHGAEIAHGNLTDEELVAVESFLNTLNSELRETH